MRAYRFIDLLFGTDLDVIARTRLRAMQAGACVNGANHFRDKTKAFVEVAEMN